VPLLLGPTRRVGSAIATHSVLLLLSHARASSTSLVDSSSIVKNFKCFKSLLLSLSSSGRRAVLTLLLLLLLLPSEEEEEEERRVVASSSTSGGKVVVMFCRMRSKFS